LASGLCETDTLHIPITTACEAFHCVPDDEATPMLQADYTYHPANWPGYETLSENFHTTQVYIPCVQANREITPPTLVVLTLHTIVSSAIGSTGGRPAGHLRGV
jgi:hypothetical protein